MTRKIAIANTKGGTNKSTTATNFSAIAAKKKKKALLVDFDPQGSSSQNSGIDELRDLNIDDYASHRIIMDGVKPSELIIETPYGYDLIPASDMLYGADNAIKEMRMGETILQRIFNQDEGLKKYDYIFCDTQGAPSSLVSAVINMCGEVVIPNVAANDSTRALDKLLDLIDGINDFRRAYTPDDLVTILGHFFGRARVNTQVHKRQTEKMFEKLGDIHLKLFNVKYAEDLLKAVEYGMPLTHALPEHPASEQYEALFNRLFKEVK